MRLPFSRLAEEPDGARPIGGETVGAHGFQPVVHVHFDGPLVQYDAQLDLVGVAIEWGGPVAPVSVCVAVAVQDDTP